MARPRKTAAAEATPEASTETPSTAAKPRKPRKPRSDRGKKRAQAQRIAGPGTRTRGTGANPLTAFREGLSFYREMQKEIGLPGTSHISAQEWMLLIEDVQRIGGMVTRLCEREGVQVTPLRTGTTG